MNVTNTNDLIKRARKMQGITQDEMAEKLNIKRSTYAYKEAKSSFTFDEVKIISRVLNIAIQYIADPKYYDKLLFPPKIPKKNSFVRLEAPPPLKLKSEDPFDGLITHNERQLLKGYRLLKTQESKEKFKAYLEQLQKEEAESENSNNENNAED